MPSPRVRRDRRRARTAVLVACVLLSACTGSQEPATSGADSASPSVAPEPDRTAPAAGTQVGIPNPDDIDPGRLAPLAGLPACQDPPEQPPDVDVGPVPVPEEAIVAQASTSGPLQSAQGYSPRTPVEIMVAYLRIPGWEVLAAEDEVFESEVLLTDGQLRLFVKSQASCARGSAFVLFASTDPDAVPVPAGTP